jgi:hypothetical protein
LARAGERLTATRCRERRPDQDQATSWLLESSLSGQGLDSHSASRRFAAACRRWPSAAGRRRRVDRCRSVRRTLARAVPAGVCDDLLAGRRGRGAHPVASRTRPPRRVPERARRWPSRAARRDSR